MAQFGLAHARFDVIIDIVAGADMPSVFARLNPNGRMVVVGVVASYPPADFGMTMMAARVDSTPPMSLASLAAKMPLRLGRDGEAAAKFRRAAALTRNIPERTVLLRRAAECDARM